MDTSKYLPIGSIITIEQSDKEIMIIGYMAYSEDNKDEIISRDYVGIPVEEGYKEDNRILFNKENISNIIFMGYKTESTINTLKILDNSLDLLKRTKPEDDILKELLVNNINSGINSKITRVSENKVLKEENDE